MRKSLRDSTQLTQTIQKPLHNILRIRELTITERNVQFRDTVIQVKIFFRLLQSSEFVSS
jgi:hypothetical protein